jgi:hypothetical protein
MRRLYGEYREHLAEVKITGELFNGFTAQLEKKKVITYSESIVDATFEPLTKTQKRENKSKSLIRAQGWNTCLG